MSLLICPVCELPLEQHERTMRCAAGHSFDLAREGYVNLLAAGHGKSKLEGDSAAMLQARRRTFERGHYLPLSDAINAAGRNARVVLDAGCGEGYYLGRLGADPSTESCYGFDLSTHALKLAARTYAGVVFFASDVKHKICMADASVHLLLNIFAPRNTAEFARVLSADGTLLVVIPGSDHFEPLRSDLGLLAIDDDKAERTVDQLRSHFDLRESAAVQYAITAGGQELADLLQMTPNYWHLEEDALVAATDRAAQDVTLSFEVMQFGRR